MLSSTHKFFYLMSKNNPFGVSCANGMEQILHTKYTKYHETDKHNYYWTDSGDSGIFQCQKSRPDGFTAFRYDERDLRSKS